MRAEENSMRQWLGGEIDVQARDEVERRATCQRQRDIKAMRILVAEDHPSLARSIASGLREEGYAVDITFDGEDAMDRVKVNTYDAIVLDMMLPGKAGC